MTVGVLPFSGESKTMGGRGVNVRRETSGSLAFKVSGDWIAPFAKELLKIRMANARLAEIATWNRFTAASFCDLLIRWRPLLGFSFGNSLVTLYVKDIGYQVDDGKRRARYPRSYEVVIPPHPFFQVTCNNNMS